MFIEVKKLEEIIDPKNYHDVEKYEKFSMIPIRRLRLIKIQ